MPFYAMLVGKAERFHSGGTDAVDVGQGFGSNPDYDRLSYRN